MGGIPIVGNISDTYQGKTEKKKKKLPVKRVGSWTREVAQHLKPPPSLVSSTHIQGMHNNL